MRDKIKEILMDIFDLPAELIPDAAIKEIMDLFQDELDKCL